MPAPFSEPLQHLEHFLRVFIALDARHLAVVDANAASERGEWVRPADAISE